MYSCSKCVKNYKKWQGQCDQCKEWNSLVEVSSPLSNNAKNDKRSISKFKDGEAAKAVNFQDIIKDKKLDLKSEYLYTKIQEVDNTLGGRLIKGQVILLSGEPGIGKSTLSLQIINSFSEQGKKILYVCGEESPMQIFDRAQRLRLELENVVFLPELNIANIEQYVNVNRDKIDFIIVDSIQTLYSPDSNSNSGSVSQIAECTNRIVNLSKGFGMTTIIIGHVTKSGDIAGPKILEHMVDTVLYFEGDRKYEYRVLRVEKNRYGPADEAGIFRMSQKGLEEVKDTSELINLKSDDTPGSVFAMAVEGSRPIAIEVQALAVRSYFSNPRRTTSGFDLNRLYILLAILDKKLKLNTGEHDIYINITGGIKISDPGLDLAVLVAVYSSLKNIIIPKTNVYFGEIGLTGEIRKVFMAEKRLKEAKRIGFDEIIDSKAKKIESVFA